MIRLKHMWGLDIGKEYDSKDQYHLPEIGVPWHSPADMDWRGTRCPRGEDAYRASSPYQSESIASPAEKHSPAGPVLHASKAKLTSQAWSNSFSPSTLLVPQACHRSKIRDLQNLGSLDIRTAARDGLDHGKVGGIHNFFKSVFASAASSGVNQRPATKSSMPLVYFSIKLCLVPYICLSWSMLNGIL